MAPSSPLPAQDEIRSTRFRQEREAGWRRLEEIVAKVERKGVRSLSFEEARDLATLYRQAVNSLSVAREISLDRALLDYLDALSARAYLAVYAPQETLGGLLWRFLSRGIPQAVRRSAWHILLGAFALSLGALGGWLLFMSDPAWFNTLVPRAFGDPRGPEATREVLLSVIYDEEEPEGGELAAFAAFLFSNNARVAFFAFALGILACVPTFLLVAWNGMILGFFLALHFDREVGWDLVGWLSIHGVTELAAIVIAAGAGFRLGWVVIFPGNLTRRSALRGAGRDVAKLAILATMMLFVAGLIEGFLRQTVQSIEWRYAIGWGFGLLWLAWFTLAGRGPGPDALRSQEVRP